MGIGTGPALRRRGSFSNCSSASRIGLGQESKGRIPLSVMHFYVSADTCGTPPALAASTIESVTVWVRAGAALVVAVLAGALSGCLLTVTAPAGVTRPWPGPVLETVTPAQLAAMSMRLDATVQPVELPSWLEIAGLRLPTTILLAGDAESSVRQNSGAVRDVMERILTRATVTAPT